MAGEQLLCTTPEVLASEAIMLNRSSKRQECFRQLIFDVGGHQQLAFIVLSWHYHMTPSPECDQNYFYIWV